MKSSPDGHKMALATWSASFVEMYDFDNVTGILSNVIHDSLGFAAEGPYGIEFSPNSRYVYAAETNPGGSSIYQYDLQAGNAAQVVASRQTITTQTAQMGALQLAPDQKIYAVEWGAAYLDVINSPNLGGSACNFQTNAVPLGRRRKPANWRPSLIL